MPGTYSQLYIQIIFAVRDRENLIQPSWKDDLHSYISGIVTNKGQKSIIVNGMPDHVHVFVGLKPAMAVSDLVRDIKNNSSKFVNENKLSRGHFSWQEGFGAFSYSRSQLDSVYKYIENQEVHHRVRTFREEYLEMLKKFCVDYDQKYLFDWIDEK